MKNGNYCKILRYSHEPYEHYLERVNFILSNIDNEGANKTIETYSKIYINILYHGIKYDNELMDKIKDMTLNITSLL